MDYVLAQPDYEAAVAALTYIAERIEEPTFHSVCKVLYGAEKRHLEEALPIVGDTYVAMQRGPVPSVLYDMLERLRDPRQSPSIDPRLVELVKRHLEVRGRYRLLVLSPADTEALSASSRKCLDAAVAEIGRMHFSERTRWSHDAAWEAAAENGVMTWQSIAMTLPNGEIIADHLRGPYPDA
jgi:hypothetical protein